MKIAHIVSTYPPYIGGMGNVAAAMVKELEKRGHSCKVITPDHEGIKSVLSFGNAAWLPSLTKHLHGVDIIHLHYPFYGGAQAVRLFKRKNPAVPLVMTYHMDNIGTGLKKLFFSSYRHTMFPWIMKQVDVVTVGSLDYAKHSFLTPYLNKKMVVELPYGVDEAFQPGDQKYTRHGPDPTLQLLFVATLDKAHYFKGLLVLLEALQNVKMSMRLTVVGDGDLRSHYEEIVKKRDLLNKASFLGNLSQEDLIKQFQQADLSVLPSVDQSEAFGLVLVESMACGTPVLASDLPGVRSVFDDGKTGFVVAVNNAKALSAKLDEVARDLGRLEKMRNAASQRANELYRWPKIVDRLEGLYENNRAGGHDC